MNSYRETDAHQRAKAAIMEGSQQAGYEAVAEAIGDGWRADVLAVRGSVRIAFEVQWSFLKLRDTRARQERYARDGVRGCWFFRQPPAMLEHEDTLDARRDLPLFHMFANADGSFAVRLCGRLTPLDAFVAALLGGRIRFCEEAAAADHLTATFDFYPIRCATCGKTAHIYRVGSALTARCGTRIPASGAMAFVGWRAEFLAAARQLAGSDPALHLAQIVLGEGEPRAVCPFCGSGFEARRLEMAGYGEQPYRRLTGTATLRRPLILKAAHWCFPPEAILEGERENDYCCTVERTPSKA